MRRLSLLAMKRSSSKKRKKSKGSEVREVFQTKLPTISERALDPEFKEIEDEEKGMETDISSEDFELKENDNSIQKQENDTTKKRYKNKVRRIGRLSIKALGKFTNTADDPICLETDESVKIDCTAIQQLLGVPCGEVTIESMSKLKTRNNSVKAWRNRYNFVTPTELVNNIENAEDDDCFNFRMDFLILLYVDSVECKWIKMDKKMNLICFWNMSRLKERQKWEIKNGGFGIGMYKRLTKVIKDEDEENSGYSVVVNMDVNADIVNGEEKDEKDNVRMINEKEKGVGELHEFDTTSLGQGDLEEGHNRQDTGVEFVEKTISEGDKQDVEKTIGEGDKQPVEAPEEKKETTALKENDSVKADKNLEITEEMSDEEQGKHRITEQENTSENVYDGPPLQSKDCDDEAKQIEEKNLEKMVDRKECCVSGERDEGVMEKRDQVIKTMEEKRRNPVREIGLAMVSKSPYRLRGVDITEAITKEEKLVWEYLFKEDGMMYKLYGKKKRKLETDDESKMGKEDDIKGKGKVGTDDESEIVYRNNSNLKPEKFRFKTLKEDTKVFNKVIDAWGDVLNFDEKYRSPTSPYRLFCDTNLINTSLIDLRAIDMVFLPMLENGHYYLIVFELKHTTISVIDKFQ
ncbi:hypothetical protein L1987_37959 [Smallanthus sonchifolius]|uniref:Uncharacterized protein n=1 Tax=Smallanthus sonchifolius TaxID=185202 RepID=A0ACB9HHC4_9ASTR|nr:hypothetical protein L1987_37959 [Smallanthus sonchifolius]